MKFQAILLASASLVALVAAQDSGSSSGSSDSGSDSTGGNGGDGGNGGNSDSSNSNKGIQGPQPLVGSSAAGDPPSIGVAVLLANWTGRGSPSSARYELAIHI